jgi:hypothetical protein
MRLRWFVLVAVAALGTRPAAAQKLDGGAGLGLVWAQPIGAFARTADPTVGISMWLAIGQPRSGWAVRGEFHFVEEHPVADGIPDPHFVPAPGLTTPELISLYTDIVGVTFGPVMIGHLGRAPSSAWLAFGIDDVEPSCGWSEGPLRFGDEPGAPGGSSFSIALGGSVLLFAHERPDFSGGLELSVEFLVHPNASYLDRPPVDASGLHWRGTDGSANLLRIGVGFGARGPGMR